MTYDISVVTNSQNLVKEVDDQYRIKEDSLLSFISNSIIDPTYFIEINCKSPFNDAHFYKIRVKYDPLDADHRYQLVFSSAPISTHEFSIIIRKGPLISSEEKTIEYLTYEISNYKKLNHQNDTFIPLGFKIKENQYMILFQTKQDQITSLIPIFNRVTLEQRLLILNQLTSILIDAHKNDVFGFCLNPFNIFYDKYSKRISLFGFFGNSNILSSNFDLTNIDWSSLLAPELLSGDNFPTIQSDIYQLSILFGTILGSEMEKWENGTFDSIYKFVEEQLYIELRKKISNNPNDRGNLNDLYEKIRNCCQSSIRDPNMQTLKLIKNNLPGLHLDQIEGMDLVIFLGNTQVGKSATINALRGLKFINEKGRIKQTNTIENEAQMGNKTGLSCTLLPVVYVDQQNNIAYLDTRGFNDVRNQPPSFEVASSFLIEIAIRTAKNVRIVVLEKFEKLRSGLAEFNQIGQALQKVIKEQNSYVNCYFLFNRYTVSTMEEAQEFFSLNEQEKTHKILSEILENANNMIEQDTDISNYKYLTLLYENLSVYHFGYIELCNNDSINTVLLSIKNDSLNVNKNDLRFTGFNQERLKFNDIFIPRLLSINYIMKYLFKLPDSQSLDEKVLSLNEQIKAHSKNIQSLQSINDTDIHEVLEPLKQLYQETSKEEMQILLDLLEKAKKDLNDEMEKHENFMSTKEIIFDENWKCEGSDYKCTVKYTGNIPWEEDKITQNNPEYTKFSQKVGNPHTTKYKIEFENTSPPSRDSQIMSYLSVGIEGGFTAGTYIAGYGLSAAFFTGLAGVFVMGVAPLSITAALLSAPLMIAKGSLVAGAVAAVGAPALATTAGVVDAMNLPKKVISGNVRLYAMKKDIPSRQIELVDINGHIENIRNRITQINNDIVNLDKRNAEEILSQINDKKKIVQSTLQKIIEVKNAIQCIMDFLVNNIDDISLYVEISTRLSGPGQNADQELFNNIARYGRILLNWIQNNERSIPDFQWEDNAINSQVSALICDINQLKKDLETQELFGVYDLNPFKQ